MRKIKSVALSGFILCLVILATSGGYAYFREQNVLKVKTGMTKIEVENLIGSGEEGFTGCSAQLCPENSKQYWYPANPSLWFGRLEDNLMVCYNGNTICELKRVGL